MYFPKFQKVILVFALLFAKTLTAQSSMPELPIVNDNPNSAFLDSSGCVVCDQYAVGDSFSLDSGLTWYTVVDRPLLETMRDNGSDLSKVCVSLVTDMSFLFYQKYSFNQDIGGWDVSNVTDMSHVFNNARAFNQDIGNWDVSSIQNMSHLFENAHSFNQDIGSWDVSNVTNMSWMFRNAKNFNSPSIDNWDVSNVSNMSHMFWQANSFNHDLNSWDVSNVLDMSNMFGTTTNYIGMDFNSDIGSWDVSSVTNMSGMFWGANNFNQDIGAWDVSNVSDMSLMFYNAWNFNKDIGSWDVSNVTNMNNLFGYANFFDQDLSNWDVSNVTIMSQMFFAARAFNQNISSWNTTNLVWCNSMFRSADSFSQDLSSWCVWNVIDTPSSFGIYGSFEPQWGTCPNSPVLLNPNSAYVNNRGCLVCDQYAVGDTFSLDSGLTYNVAVDSIDLFQMIISGKNLERACISHVSNLENSFNQRNVVGNITKWDVSNVVNMSGLFSESNFNQNIDNWDVSNVSDMSLMFYFNVGFNQNIGSWDVSSVIDMSHMFENSWEFNQDISSWDVSNVTNMDYMFTASNFNQDLNRWCVTNIPTQPIYFATNSALTPANEPNWGSCGPAIVYNNPNSAFLDSSGCVVCDQYAVGDTFSLDSGLTWYTVVDRPLLETMRDNGDDLSKVCVSLVTDMNRLFMDKTLFNQDIGNWDVSNVKNMKFMFYKASSFDQNIGNWDVSNVISMAGLFHTANTFNSNIGNWDVSNVYDMSGMFSGANSFNQNIGNWDVSNVNQMQFMFQNNHSFNQDIGNWDVSSVTNMSFIFSNTYSFNQDISSWDVSNVIDMGWMFLLASDFNQDIGSWNVSNVTDMSYMFYGASAFNQDLNSWCVTNIPAQPTGFATNSTLTPANEPNWGSCGPAIVYNPDSAYVNTTTPGLGCVVCDQYAVGDTFSLDSGVTWYTVVDRPLLETMRDNGDDLTKVCVSHITDMSAVFAGQQTFNQDIGNWDVSNVTYMWGMFGNAQAFNQDIGGWDVSNVTNMMEMFENAQAFNKDIGGWDVSNVTYMFGMFSYASAFNQDIGNWDVSNVTNMETMFAAANSFNQDIGNWDVSNVTNMSGMFQFTQLFNQDIGNWDVSNVTNMNWLFRNTDAFNQDIGNWDVSNVTQMHLMFENAAIFNQDLSNWCVTNIPAQPTDFATNSALTQANQPNWGSCPPCDYTQPINDTVYLSQNDTAVFNLAYYGNQRTFQWQFFNGNNWVSLQAQNSVLSGGTTGVLKINTPSLSMDGSLFRCILGGCNQDTTDVVSLRVIQFLNCPDTILSQPSNYTMIGTDTATFDINFGGSNEHYIWQYSKNATLWNDFIPSSKATGINSSALTLNGLSSTLSGLHVRCVIQGECDTLISNSAILTIIDSVQLSVDILNNTCNSDSVDLRYYSNTPFDSIFWSDGSNLSSVWLNRNNYPNAIITGFINGRAYSTSQNIFKGEFSEQPNNGIGIAGVDTVIFRVNHTGLNTKFQWQSFIGGNWINLGMQNSILSGGQSDSLVIHNLKLSHDSLLIRCLVVENDCVDTSQVVMLRVYDSVELNVIKISQNCSSGQVLVSYSSNLPLDSLFWSNGAVGDTVLFDVNTITSAQIEAHIFGKTYKDSIQISRGKFISQPMDALGIAGIDTATFLALHSGINSSFQWQAFLGNQWVNLKDSTSIYKGGMSTQLQITNLSSSLDGIIFRCIVEDGVCQDTSNYITLNVLDSSDLSLTKTIVHCGRSEVAVSYTSPSISFDSIQWSNGSTLDTAFYSANQTTWVKFIGFYGSSSLEDSLNIDFPYITAQPMDTMVSLQNSQQTQFSVGFNSSTAIYQWAYSSDGITWFNLPANSSGLTGGQTPILTLLKVKLAFHNYQFKCIITQDSCSYESIPATLSVYNAPPYSILPNNCISCAGLSIGDEFIINGDSMIVVDRPMLDSMITGGYDVTKVCVSHITDMSAAFDGQQTFNQDIGNWDVSNVTDMRGMFNQAFSFNQNLNNWDVSNVTDMSGMFRAWGFGYMSFNGDISGWDVSSVIDFSQMFFYCDSFNQPIGNWDVSSAKDMTQMFGAATNFNQDIGSWNTGQVESMKQMFGLCNIFNQNLTYWDVSNVTNMGGMFYGASSFNRHVNFWDVSNVTDMRYMFYGAQAFNQVLNNWVVSNVTDMSYMFDGATSFGSYIGFYIQGWDVSSVTNMEGMFRGTSINSVSSFGIHQWDVSSVTNMDEMFSNATSFNEDLSNWCVTHIDSLPTDFNLNGILDTQHYPVWGTCPVPPAVMSSSTNLTASTEANEKDSFSSKLPVSIRPNPTTGIFYVHPFIDGIYSLIDSKGRTVESGRATPSYDLSSYPNGVYILRLTLETATHQIRVIKQ